MIPPVLAPGTRIDLEHLPRIREYLPPEVWQRRRIFFYEGMQIRLGPCHRRYPVPASIEQATEANGGKAMLDEAGNLRGYTGQGLPFPPASIATDDPRAGARWAWDYRYRYQGAGFRGEFRIIHVIRAGRKTERFEGEFFLLRMNGYPGAGNGDERFWAGGHFDKPAMSRGLAWLQLRKVGTDRKYDRADDVWVYLPDARRVRRAPQFGVDGLYMPTYTRGQQAGGVRFELPDGSGGTPSIQIGATEHTRRGFVGLVIRPNAYRFRLLRTQDVLAPINSDLLGYPLDPDRSYGPSGLSVASGRWEIRRAVVLRGERRDRQAGIGSLTLYVDALTQAPLYLITRKPNESVKEVGIFVGKFTGDDPLAPRWEGGDLDFGAILPVAQTFLVAGEGGWIRESFDLRSDLPDDKERQRMTSPSHLEHGH